jgi:hypothetical protein
MISTASGIVLGFLLATIYGAAFHLFVGGPPRRIILYVIASWVGFTIGHIVGDLLSVDILLLGAVQLLTASVGAWIALILSWFLERSRG